MATKKKYNEDDLKTIFYELQTELLKFKSSLSKLETDLGILQAGDKSGPYWNGDNACEVYKACLGHFEHDKNLLAKLEKCCDNVESAISK